MVRGSAEGGQQELRVRGEGVLTWDEGLLGVFGVVVEAEALREVEREVLEPGACVLQQRRERDGVLDAPALCLDAAQRAAGARPAHDFEVDVARHVFELQGVDADVCWCDWRVSRRRTDDLRDGVEMKVLDLGEEAEHAEDVVGRVPGRTDVHERKLVEGV